jgi:3-oxoacyl-(acyl-carrier-protein) synthase
MSKQFLVGGSEAPLTTFTIAQMQAMKIYVGIIDNDFPCRANDFLKTKNSMILGEAAAVCCLDLDKKNATAVLDGIGFATEILEHNTSISAEATCFQKSMKMALLEVNTHELDAIVMHSPGTVKGDLAELRAIEMVFGIKTPLLTTNKWKIGHSLGASGMMSLEFAIMMLQNQTFVGTPFSNEFLTQTTLKKIMVNSVGFGGNAVSVVISLPEN